MAKHAARKVLAAAFDEELYALEVGQRVFFLFTGRTWRVARTITQISD